MRYREGMRWIGLLALAFGIGCGGPKCAGDASTQCAAQCGGGPSQNICYPDPVRDSDGCWQCFCQPCVSDMAMTLPYDMANHD